MLVQQKDYIFENLPIGSRWSDYGIDRVITTTEASKKYIMDYFPESLVFIIPPIIEDIFSPLNLPSKPYVAINCRDRIMQRRLISEFYIKFPQLRWVTFRDMIQLTYDEFATNLKECMVSLWVDDESTFGTFPLESMKCSVPVVGKIPNTEPDWLSENGMWTYDANKLVEILGTYVLAWLEGVELTDEVNNKMKETLLPYEKAITQNNIITVFNSFKNKRISDIKNAIENLKQEETV
jgi:glycosyltransferase involved in cell wall biosynthesis